MRLLVTLFVLLSASVGLAAPRVSLELATDKGFPIGGAHEWHKLLSGLGVVNLRIRAATGADQPAVEELGDPKNPSYRVVGILTAGNLLVVPGGKFSPRDGAAIRAWLENLADQGEAGVTERKSAFGLLGKQLVEVQEDLEQPILFATKGMALADAVDKASRTLKVPTVIDASAKIAMEEVVLEDELEGISSGTALAAMLRPAGLVLAPERPKGGELQYRIAKPVEGRESWPIGWPSEKKPIDILPDLYEFVNVEISDTPVNEAVAAIAEQLKVPFLYDRNAMAWHEIDLTKVNATVPSKRSTYSLILQKVLGQAKMKPELRLDEANKPFYWVTTSKPMK
jgi:hypothetical protein